MQDAATIELISTVCVAILVIYTFHLVCVHYEKRVLETRWLDSIALIYNMRRSPGESNKALRKRLLHYISGKQ